MTDAQIVANLRVGESFSAGSASLPEVAANEAHSKQGQRFRSGSGKKTLSLIFYLSVLLVVYQGWLNRGAAYLTPEQGAGYVLGIIGGVLMLLLLLYPVRKHARWMRGFGPVRYWFQAHMLMGTFGPVLILFHCNFQSGSPNGNVALFSMLLVASSGIVGRFFYTKIHYGLYGQKTDLARLGSEAATAKVHMDLVFEILPELKVRLNRLESIAGADSGGFLASLLRVLVIGIRTRWCRFVAGVLIRYAFKVSTGRNQWTSEQRRSVHRSARFWLCAYLETVRRVAGFTFYERLFSLWHILHLPLFIMLVISGFVHVYAVHLY
jgi:hypothetical protein